MLLPIMVLEDYYYHDVNSETHYCSKCRELGVVGAHLKMRCHSKLPNFPQGYGKINELYSDHWFSHFVHPLL